MRLTNKKILSKFQKKHPAAKGWIENWCRVVEKTCWKKSHDLKMSFPRSDWITGGIIVFDVCHNDYRLIARFNLNKKTVFACWVGKHKEYDRIKAKNICDG